MSKLLIKSGTMGFNSLEYFIFLPLVFIIYWNYCNTARKQNIFLLVASYLFYGMADWRFLLLIAFSSVLDYSLGKKIYEHVRTNQSKAKIILRISLLSNLGLLAFFKYYNFFVQSFLEFFNQLGLHPSIHTLKIIMPIGISFYTFQTMSYTIDIYRKRLKPTNDIVLFFTFVSFFPQLVTGPIEKASKMIRQFEVKRVFNREEATEGLKFILYGLFKKIVIADYTGQYANQLFNNYGAYSSIDLVFGVFFFAIQLYADFSAYTDIAIGSGKLLGIRLSRNFAYPFYAKNIEEFWQRWHITLTVWFRDYVFLSLNRGPLKVLGYTTIGFISFGLIGLWHGPNYTFILWGFINGAIYVIFQKLKKTGIIKPLNRRSELIHFPQFWFTSSLMAFLLVFFRSPSLSATFGYYQAILTPSLFSIPTMWQFSFWALFLYIWEWHFRDHLHALHFPNIKRWQRWSIYIAFTMVTMYHFGIEREFLYFQF